MQTTYTVIGYDDIIAGDPDLIRTYEGITADKLSDLVASMLADGTGITRVEIERE